MSLTNEQLQIITYSPNGKSIIINSTAGSGKTLSIVKRLEFLLNEHNIEPSKILFLSFTNNAINELRSRIQHPNKEDIKIVTIHSFCSTILGKLRKFRPIKTFDDFKAWYKYTQQPKNKNTKKYQQYIKNVNILDNPKENLSGEFSKFKLLKADNKKYRLPKLFKQYQNFLYTTKSIDFADMLIRTFNATKTKEWKDIFSGKYDYIFVDEYQDTSTLQMKILLSLNAKQYCLVGDRNQQIYQFTGTSNCLDVENLLKELHTVKEFNLTKNFRCTDTVVKYANNFTALKAISSTTSTSTIDLELKTLYGVEKLLKTNNSVTFLVRTNSAIRKLEEILLKSKVKIKYTHIINNKIALDFYNGKLTKKQMLFYELLADDAFVDVFDMFDFVKNCNDSKHTIMSIHKSKGLEFDNIVIVNSFNEDVVDNNNICFEDKKEFEYYCVYNKESQNIHYVALTRSKGSVYFMMIDKDN